MDKNLKNIYENVESINNHISTPVTDADSLKGINKAPIKKNFNESKLNL